MMQKNILFIFILGLICLSSCRKDKPDEQLTPMPTISANGGVYITNEGNFLFGNASVSYYDFASNTSTPDLFQPANGSPLGDICQSMAFFNNKAYVVVNNSGKIEVVNPTTFVKSATITGFVSPRYMLPVSNSKAYVSDLYANAISIVNLSTNTVIGTIPCTGWTEEMVLAYGKAFVTNLLSDKVYVVNTATDLLEDSIQVVYGSNSIREDKNGKLWVLCGGKKSSGIYPALVKINPISKQVEQTYTFSAITSSPQRLTINGNLDVIYFLDDGGVYKHAIADTLLPASPIIAKNSYNFYSLGIDPATGIIYVADAIDYVQNGVVMRYQSDGTYINSYSVGIIPGNFYFN